MKRQTLLLAWLGVTIFGWLLWAAESVSPPAKFVATLPEPVRRQLTRLFPESELVRVDFKSMDGRPAYALKGVSPEGKRNFWLYVTENAEVIRIAEQLAETELSPAVQRAALKAFPGYFIETAEKKSEIKVSYLLRIRAEDKRLELLLTPEGNILEIRKEGNLIHANTPN
jgi:hypothetical protein